MIDYSSESAFLRGRDVVAAFDLPKVAVWVRFPSPAPIFNNLVILMVYAFDNYLVYTNPTRINGNNSFYLAKSSGIQSAVFSC